MESLGERVVAARKQLGLTRRALAKAAFLHEYHLANIERGHRSRLAGETLQKLAKALGVTIEFLLGPDKDKDSQSEGKPTGVALVGT